MLTSDEYKKRIRTYLQSPEASDEVWEYVLLALLDVAATQGLLLLDKEILSREEWLESGRPK